MIFHYHTYGLQFNSDQELPELPASTINRPVDIEIRKANLSSALTDPRYANGNHQVAPGVYQFRIPGIARYRVEDGSRILVDADPNADPGDVRLWMLGTALGALLHQRGGLPLHASAFSCEGQVIAFCGDSGAGKSTLAAALHRRGLSLLTDDVGLLSVESDCIAFHAGFPRIKLWRDSLEHFELNPDNLIRDLTRADKFHLLLTEFFDARTLPLRIVYVLDKSIDDEFHIAPIRGHAAISVIRSNTYRPELIRPLGKAVDHLRQCGLVAQNVQVFRFSRPWRLERLEDSIDVLLNHLECFAY